MAHAKAPAKPFIPLGEPGVIEAGDRDRQRMGRMGELRTAKRLDAVARRYGVGALYGLDTGVQGNSADVDAVLVSGRTVWILDSKLWEPGRYVSLFGCAWIFRPTGGKKARIQRKSEIDRNAKGERKKTYEMTLESFTRRLAGIPGVVVKRPRLVVWCSKPKVGVSVRWLRVPGASAMRGPAFAGWLERQRLQPPDPRIINALAPLVRQRPAPTPRRAYRSEYRDAA